MILRPKIVRLSKKAEPDLRIKFGRRVRALRETRGLTQEQLAERAQISVDFLSLIERGRNSPSFENLEALACALGLAVASLFTFSQADSQ
jgi:transcriptional regulator with XRE-family HTH domain